MSIFCVNLSAHGKQLHVHRWNCTRHELNRPCDRPTRFWKPSRSLRSSRLLGNGASAVDVALSVDAHPSGRQSGVRGCCCYPEGMKKHTFFCFFLRARLCVYFFFIVFICLCGFGKIEKTWLKLLILNCLIGKISDFNYHKMRVCCHRLRVNYHRLRVNYHKMRVCCHRLRVNYHKMRVNCHKCRIVWHLHWLNTTFFVVCPQYQRRTITNWGWTETK